jgi:hypothetical protein
MAVKGLYNLLKRSHALPATAGAFLKDAHPIIWGVRSPTKLEVLIIRTPGILITGRYYAHPEALGCYKSYALPEYRGVRNKIHIIIFNSTIYSKK